MELARRFVTYSEDDGQKKQHVYLIATASVVVETD